MKGWPLRMWSPGFVALGRAFAVSTALITPSSLAAQVFNPWSPEAEQENSAATGAVQQAVALLEQLRHDQARLADAVRRLEAGQATGWERQARAIRHHQDAIAERLSVERERDRQAQEELGRMVLTLSLSVAGALLFAMIAVAWSVLRALQRLTARSLLPQMVAPDGAMSLSMHADPQLLSLVAELEKRWLKVEEPGRRSAEAESADTESGKASKMFPGDFL